MKKFFTFVTAVLFMGTMMAADLLTVNFKAKGQGDWTIENKVLPEGISYVWIHDSKYGMKASGYVSGARYETDSWLVSPAIDLSSVTSANLTVKQALNYATSEWVSILAKAGEGEWTALDVKNWPAGNSWSFVESTADLSAFAGKADVQLAFKYTSSTSTAATWEIESLTIVDVAEPVDEADVTFLPADFEGQGVEQTGGPVEATKNGVTVSASKAFGHNLALRAYKGSSVSIVSETEQIGKLKFQFYSTNTGGLDKEIVVNAKEWSVAELPSAARFEKIEIYFGEFEKPEIDTITVAKALEVGNALAQGDVTPEEYVIQGYVSHIYSFFSEDFKNETFWISDDPTSTTTENAFEVYRGKPADGKEIGWGAKVVVKCKIKNFNGTIENDGNGINVSIVEASTFVPDTLSVEEAVEIANGLENDKKAPKYSVVKAFIHEAPIPYNYKENNKWVNTTFTVSQLPNEAGALSVYKANILKADTAKLVAGSYALIKGYIMKHNSSPQIAEGADVKFVEAPKEDTIRVNVAEALEAGLALPMGDKSDKVYAVTGFVNSAEPFEAGVQTFYMADDATSEAENFFVPDVAIEAEAPVGQKVEVVGRLQNADGETVTIENGKARLLWPEGIESIVLTEKAQKVVVDGVIYIVRDNKLFNLQGAQVR